MNRIPKDKTHRIFQRYICKQHVVRREYISKVLSLIGAPSLNERNERIYRLPTKATTTGTQEILLNDE